MDQLNDFADSCVEHYIGSDDDFDAQPPRAPRPRLCKTWRDDLPDDVNMHCFTKPETNEDYFVFLHGFSPSSGLNGRLGWRDPLPPAPGERYAVRLFPDSVILKFITGDYATLQEFMRRKDGERVSVEPDNLSAFDVASHR